MFPANIFIDNFGQSSYLLSGGEKADGIVQLLNFLNSSSDWLLPALGGLGGVIAWVYQVFSSHLAAKNKEIRALQRRMDEEFAAGAERTLGQLEVVQSLLQTEQDENNMLVQKLEDKDRLIYELQAKLSKYQGYVEDLQAIIHGLHRNHQGEGITEVLRRTSED